MTAFDQAWEIAKMGYPGMPLDETSDYYDYIAEKLGLGEPFATGEQRRVFNILDQPEFVAKVVNSEGLSEGGWPPKTYTYDPGMYGATKRDSRTYEDFVYRKLAALIPNTAKKFLLPGEAMGHIQNISGVVRQPRVNVHEWDPQDPLNTNFHNGKVTDWQKGFLTEAREELESNNFPQAYGDISRFMQEQDYGPGNFSEDMKLLDYYWPYKNEGDVFGD